MKWEVMVTRDVTESVLVEVEAETPKLADELALERARNGELEWQRNDCWPGDPYVGDDEAGTETA